MGTGFMATVGQSGAVGRTIVFFLFIVSVYAWAIILYKYLMLRRAEVRSGRLLKKFQENPDGMVNHYNDRTRFERSPVAVVLEAGLAQLALIMQGRSGARGLSIVQVDGLDRSLDRAIAEEVLDLRRYLVTLATIVGAAPFVGLFGTVWGIMKAFTAMYVTGSASISSVAPGISAALTTTVAGLAVAIPALAGYNYLTNRVRTITTRMESFSSEFLSTVERNLGDP
ncbi:MotA/TolQ/ExbB proton channel family protein [bacterium]|nr:MotA/TolQ/ExbB proton channel family protein [bacterium]